MAFTGLQGLRVSESKTFSANVEGDLSNMNNHPLPQSEHSISTKKTDSSLVKSLILISSSCVIAGLMWGSIYAMAGLYKAMYLPFAFSVIVGLALLLYFITKYYYILLYTQLIMILLIPTFLQWVMGGIAASGVVIFWAIIAPLGSLIFQKTRQAIFWIFAYLLLLAISLIYDSYFQNWSVEVVNPQFKTLFYAMNIIGPSLVTFLTVIYYTRTLKKEKQSVIFYTKELEKEKQAVVFYNQELEKEKQSVVFYNQELEKEKQNVEQFATLILDENQQIVKTNDKFCQLYECTNGELEGRTLDELFSPKDRQGEANYFKLLSQYDGGMLDILITLRIQKKDYFSRLRMLMVGNRWMTYVENILHEENMVYELYSEQKKWADIFKYSGEGIVTLDIDNKISAFNQKFFDLMEFRSEHGVILNEVALNGKNIFDIIEENTFSGLQETLTKAKTNKNISFKSVIPYHDYFFHVEMHPIYLPVRGFTGSCIVIQDITAQKKLESTLTELKQSQAQLVQSEKMAALGQLIGGIAHEINTPAGAIYSGIKEIDGNYLPLLEKMVRLLETLSSPLQVKFLEACHFIMQAQKDISTSDRRKIARGILRKLEGHNIENAYSISQDLAMFGLSEENIDGFLDLFIAPESPQILESLHQLGLSQIHVRDIKIAIDRIVQLVKALKHHSHLDEDKLISTNLSEDLDNTLIILNNKIKRAIVVHKEYSEVPPVKCYADQLNQVWTNLIHNSIQAMRGEGELFLRLKQSNKNTICIEIEDNGPGIPEEIQSRIFEPYFTTKQKGEGTGIGLSLSKEIVERHNGTIELESRPGKTCFKVSIPIDSSIVENNTSKVLKETLL